MDRPTLPDVIETARLRLRPWQLTDVDDVLSYAQDPEWSRFLRLLPDPYTRSDAEQFVAMQCLLDRTSQPSWAICLEEVVIGGINVSFQFEHRLGELGYSVARRHWNQGYGTEVTRAVIDGAFQTHDDLIGVISMSDALGLESGHATVVPYDRRWPLLFDEMAGQLEHVSGSRILEVEHVGSTSVEGLAAKPILDILVGVADLDRSRELFSPLRRLGFEHRPGEEIPDRHFFRKRKREFRTHHLSLAEPGSTHYRTTLIFRDALRADPALARSYEVLKLNLARRYPRDREAYQSGKSEFVQRVLRTAAARDRPHSKAAHGHHGTSR